MISSTKKIFKKNKYFKIGISGRINHLKNHKIVLNLLKNYPYLRKKLRFSIAGSGENKKYLKRYINKYNLKKSVTFVGELDEKS